MGRALGLRGKSVLALVGASILVLLLAGAIGWQALESIRSQLGAAYTRNFTLLNRERILAPVARELALSQRLMASQAIRQWLLDEQNPQKKALALREAEDFRQAFADKSYFMISAQSNGYYFNDAKSAASDAPRFVLRRGDPDSAWFFNTMKSERRFNINVDPNGKLGITKVWFNVIAEDGGRRIGIGGTGLDLTSFLRAFVDTDEPGVTPMIVDANGAIQAHADVRRIAYNSGSGDTDGDKSVYRLLQGAHDGEAARAALTAAAGAPGAVETFHATLDGKRRLFGVSYIPELHWHVLTAVDLDAARLIEGGPLRWLALAGLALLALVTAGFVYAVNRLVLAPLLKLEQSARAMADGNYTVALPPARDDEIGGLTRAFGAMADKVRRHTEELEETVRARTRELTAANREMSAANKKISDSIAYASRIQRAILPERQLAAALGNDHFVLWQPRDVVGGDLYLYRPLDRGCLIGVADCAGHGVPGAFMTMLAHAALEQAITEAGPSDPAAILAHADRAMRAMLDLDGGQRELAALMDAGLAYIDLDARRILFAGAKIALYWSDGGEVGCIKGARRSLGERRSGDYRNETVELSAARTFYLATDGFLDQAGGERGFGFGNTRFVEMLRQHAGRALGEQRTAFAATLAEYQGSHPQRDDITMICFRFA